MAHPDTLQSQLTLPSFGSLFCAEALIQVGLVLPPADVAALEGLLLLRMRKSLKERLLELQVQHILQEKH